MFCRVQWHGRPYHRSWVLEVHPFCGLNTPSSCSWNLVAIRRSIGGIYPGQSPARIVCDHWPPISTLQENQLCRGRVVVLQCGLELSTRYAGPGISRVVQGMVSPNLCFVRGHPAWAIKQSENTATCAGLGDSKVKLSCEYRLAAASAGPEAHWCQLFLIWGDLGSCETWAKTSHSYGKATWVGHKLGGLKSQGISRAEQTSLARLMECQIWHQFASSAGGRL